MTYRFSPITLGAQLKSIEVGGFILTETAHAPCLALPRHVHERANVSFVLKGSFTEVVNKRPQECGPLSVLVKPAGEVHSNEYGRLGARCLIIEVKRQRLEAIRAHSKVFEWAEHVRGGLLPALALRVYQEFRARDKSSPLIIEGLVLEMLGHTTRREVRASPLAPPHWLQQARDLCHESFAQPISLVGIAASVDVHPAHLARTFRKYYQCSVGEYVRRRRLDFAAREIAQSDKSLAEIASAAGFYDHSHFTHAFKAHTGITPTEYRAETKRCNAK
ncbi:MAG TPA: helix-turn-helix transcriptional regulator [Pyrinomonadaceae bacterium]|nr:helix-turn-helix transcriptional regulator [Pyrinomonadaceae bacterium]